MLSCSRESLTEGSLARPSGGPQVSRGVDTNSLRDLPGVAWWGNCGHSRKSPAGLVRERHARRGTPWEVHPAAQAKRIEPRTGKQFVDVPVLRADLEIKVNMQERFSERIVDQIGDVPVPQNVEDFWRP